MASEGQVIAVHSFDEWNQLFQKGVESKKLVVVDFSASWCGQCRHMAPFLAQIAEKTRHVIFLRVDVDELQLVAMEYQVETMPTFLFIKEGKVVDRVVGTKKEDLQSKVNAHGGLAA